MNKKTIRIMLVEDHFGYRETIAIALEQNENMELGSQFGTAEIALRNLQNAAPEDQPDVVLLDLNLPGMSGLEALPWIKQYAPESEVIILTQSDNAADVTRAISAGAEWRGRESWWRGGRTEGSVHPPTSQREPETGSICEVAIFMCWLVWCRAP